MNSPTAPPSSEHSETPLQKFERLLALATDLDRQATEAWEAAHAAAQACDVPLPLFDRLNEEK